VSKRYTTSESDRAAMVAKGWRDFGVVFYAPGAADGTTSTIYFDDSDPKTPLYFPDGGEAAKHDKAKPAFLARKSAEAATTPLMRVHYRNFCGNSHDELVAGQARFERAYHQGDQLPAWRLHFAGITAQTTFVVEALDELCPWQDGFIGPASVADGS